MRDLNRRQLLRMAALATGGVAAGSVIAGCDTAPSRGGSSGKSVLRWWDQFEPTSAFEKELFAEFAKESGGVRVDYTVYNPQQMGESLKLAWSSKQMPDVFTLVNLGAPPSAFHQQGWFAPLELDDKHRGMLPDEALIEGKSVFDGKPHSFPILSERKHDTLTWFNTELFDKAGLDPENPPRSYDEFRSAARAIKKKGGENVSGWIAPLQMVERLGFQIRQLAMAAGAPTISGPPGIQDVDAQTGEYALHSEHFVNAIEFWLAMKRDKVLFPASSSLDARKARARWATGVAGLFMDGQYNIGVLNTGFKQFVDKVGVGPIVVPDASRAGTVNAVPAGGTFWISSKSKHRAAASRLISKFAEPEVQIGLAEFMNAPPVKPEYLDKADVHPTFRAAIETFTEQVRLAPDPLVRNPAVGDVIGTMKPIRPDLGEIVQGAVSGDLKDWRGALKKLSDSLSKERERAIADATKKGAKASVDDWRFEDWEPGADFTREMYR